MFLIVMGSVSAISGFFIDLQPSQAAQLGNANVDIVDDSGASALTAGAFAHAKVTFTTNGQLPANGKIRVRFPNGFGFNAANANCTNMNGGYMTQTGFNAGEQNTLLIVRSGDGSILPFGTTITCTISVITNPGAGSPGNYQIETLQSDGTFTAGTVIDADYAVAGDTFTAASLTNISVEHEHAPRLGRIGTVTIRFSSPTNLFFALTSKIVVTAPGYDTQYAGNYNSQSSCSTIQIGVTGGSGGQGIFILSANSGSSEGLTSEVCTISNIATPSSPNNNVSYTVQIQNANNQILAQGTGTGSNFSVGTFSAASVTTASANAEAVGNITANFTTQETVASKVEIIFPTGFTFNAGANNAATALISGTAGMMGNMNPLPNISVDTITRTITVNNPMFSATVPNQVSFVFSNIKNPASATNTSTGNFQIKLYVNNAVVEQKTDIAGVAITGVPGQTTSSTTTTQTATPSPTPTATPTSTATVTPTPTTTTPTTNTPTPSPTPQITTAQPSSDEQLNALKKEIAQLKTVQTTEKSKEEAKPAPEHAAPTVASTPTEEVKEEPIPDFGKMTVKQLKAESRNMKKEKKDLLKEYKEELFLSSDDEAKALKKEYKRQVNRLKKMEKEILKQTKKKQAEEKAKKKKK